MKKNVKIVAMLAAASLALTGCMSTEKMAENAQENQFEITMDYKGVKNGLTCTAATLSPGSSNSFSFSCDYVDFYNKYPHLKSEPVKY